MTTGLTTQQGRISWFTCFKYTVYALLTLNIALFFREEWLAAAHTFGAGVAPGDLIEAFAATIDTGAWVVLLLLFELETYILPDERIQGRLKHTLHGVRIVCYTFIVYAFYGYVSKCMAMYAFVPVDLGNLCSQLEAGLSLMIDLDEYERLDVVNCAAASSAALWQWPGQAIVTTGATLAAVQKLAWTDVINAGDWILIVLILEFDVRAQLHGALDGRVRMASIAVKSVLYPVLLAAAIYWGIAGDFLDFWDAFLWILAFVFIELNLFEWQGERREAAAV